MNAAQPDINWLDPERLYLAVAPNCELDRPIFQGDVFDRVPLPSLPNQPPAAGAVTIEHAASLCMVVPHPCQCYHGDKIRPRLTVAPIIEVNNYENFGADRTGAKDKFALPGLPALRSDGSWESRNYVADFGRLMTVPYRWLGSDQRIANLSHDGLGLLAKRVLGFQLRYPILHEVAKSYTLAEWNESFLMQAWVRRYGSLAGFTEWMRTEQVIKGINDDQPIAPYTVRAGALDALLEVMTGTPIDEPADEDN